MRIVRCEWCVVSSLPHVFFKKYFTTLQVCCTFWMRSLEMVGQMEL